MSSNARPPLALPVLFALCAMLASCGGGFELADQTCPDGGTTLTYESFGAPYFANHCNTCHGAQSTDRRGAPTQYVFDGAEQIRRWRERIFARAAGENDSMPPGPDDPPLELRIRLAEWLACGAP